MQNKRIPIILLALLCTLAVAAQPMLEHSYPFQVGRVATTDGNTRYLRSPYQSGSNWAIDIFDSNHQLLSSPVLDLPANTTDVPRLFSLPTGAIDDDPDVEFLIFSNNFSTISYHKETGVSIEPGHPNKFLAAEFVGNAIVRTNVYGLPASTPISNVPSVPLAPTLNISTFPNPTTGTLTLDLSQVSSPDVQLAVVDGMGRTLLTKNSVAGANQYQLTEFALFHAGIYWIKVMTPEGYYGWVKVVKL
jgi:hypothetical protein